MAPSSRSRTFAFTFHPNGRAESGTSNSSSSSSPYPAQKVIPINAFTPVEVENDHYKGRILLIHDTGNEIGLEADEGDDEVDSQRKGVQLQIQGKFKRASTLGADTSSGLYIGGELMSPLKLGFIMSKVVGLCASYAKKKTEGRFHFVQGDSKQNPQLAFPIAQLFTIIETAAGKQAPALGSEELRQAKWQGAGRIDVNTTSTYTFIYKTPYLDCCSWELLNVPGVSPLPLERILGQISAACVVMYDLGVAGSHANWRKGVVLEWYFTRREQGEGWLEPDEESAQSVLEEASDPSEASDGEEHHEDEVGELIAVDDDDGEGSDDTSSSEDAVDDDEDEICRAESEALIDLSTWQIRASVDPVAMEQMDIRVPFYIETIDRRRRRRLSVWYVFELAASKLQESKTEGFTSKGIQELASVSRPRPRLRAFRRRHGATRGCKCYSVQTLEQFRQLVRAQLALDSQLRRSIIASATPEVPKLELPVESSSKETSRSVSKEPTPLAPQDNSTTATSEASKGDEKTRTPEQAMNLNADALRISENSTTKDNENVKNRVDEVKEKLESLKNKAKDKAGDATKAIKNKVQRKRGPVLPPPFFKIGGSSACNLAFRNAKEGRNDMVREGMVGAVQFEGRLCEEMLRVSKDGILRCFSPYDCEKPRVRLHVSNVLRITSIEGLLLGRFYQWEVHTLLRVFVFCSPDDEDRNGWLRALQPEGDLARERPPLPLSSGSSELLTDLSRARRWRPTKRIVLNDRRLVRAEELVIAERPQLAEQILALAFQFGPEPTSNELVEFIDSTCMLKGVSFKGWSQDDLMAFWMNTYHTLLLHGRVLLGTPKSRGELARFYNRVSYLIGVKTVSLKEIETYILRIPIADRLAVKYAGRARGRQLFYCLCCKKRGQQAIGSLNSDESDSHQTPNSTKAVTTSEASKEIANKPEVVIDSPQSSDSSDEAQQNPKKKKKGPTHKRKCMPKPNVPGAHQFAAGFDQVKGKVVNKVGSLIRRDPSACLYIGEALQPLGIPEKDMRAAFCVNRGNVSCLPAISLFSGSHTNTQIEETCKRFCEEFVRIVEKDGKPTKVVLPFCCRGLKRDFSYDLEALLQFVWQFLPNSKDGEQPSRKTHVAFMKFRREPRTLQDLKRYEFAQPELMVDAFRAPEKSAEKNLQSNRQMRLPTASPNPDVSLASPDTKTSPTILSL